MTTARRDFMQADKVGIFHITNRCVRKGFLLGIDEDSGKDYNHRKFWIPELIKSLLKGYFIDIGGDAVMDNHYHLILRNRPDLTKDLTPNQIASRWLIVHPSKAMRKEKRKTPTSEELELVFVKYSVEEIRSRLSDISWFMRDLDQNIAVRANREDKCSGSFFESRFSSQVLADDAALLTCMIYCDLNPIRARIANSIETSFFTSGCERQQAEVAKNNLKNYESLIEKEPNLKPTDQQQKEIKIQKKLAKKADWLSPIMKLDLTSETNSMAPILNIPLAKYLELLDYTGREYHKNKPGIIPGTIAPILDVMEFNQNRWFENIKYYGKWYYRVLGPLSKLKDKLISTKQHWFKGVKTWEKGVKEHISTA